jgi:hypothetical protein
LKIEVRKLSELNPAEYNPRQDLQPGDHEYEKIKRSIAEFGYVDPIIINSDGTIIGGHQRFKILQSEGVTECEVSVVDLDKDREKALNIALNKTGGDWDMEKLKELIGEIDLSGLDATLTGFDQEEIKDLIGDVNLGEDWFENRKRNETGHQEGNDEYNEFVDKFEIAKTTDDCYTPDIVYEAVANWVVREYGVLREKFIRPFYPGGDYQKQKYKPDDIVVDNPPFSILSEILNFYKEHDVRFFLFAPALTLFSPSSSCCAIGVGATVLYENKASVNTSFLTNLEDAQFRTAPDLYEEVMAAVDEFSKTLRKTHPKYSYPDELVTSPMLSYLSHYGQEFRVERGGAYHIRQLDCQKDDEKVIYGSGYLISEKAAAEKAAAEKAAAEKAAAETAKKWQLSESEKEIVASLR